jgi:Diacylglycerol kinase catalytic domain
VSAAHTAGEALLVIVSPSALAVDRESVRVARDVLGAAFAMKAVVPQDLVELERVLSRKGRRRLVVIGDDQALHHVVQLLHRHSELEAGPVGIIPIGKGHKVALARSLGAAGRPVEAARAVARGAERRLDLLVDEDGGVVLSGLRIPGRGVPGQPPTATGGERSPTQASGRASGTDPADPAADRDQEFDPHAACSPRANNSRSGRGHLDQSPDHRPGSAGGGAGTSAGSPAGTSAGAPGRNAGSDAGRDAGSDAAGTPAGAWYSRLGRTAGAAARSVAAPLLAHGGGANRQFLRVEADGRLLADQDHPVGLISVWNAGSQERENPRLSRSGRDDGTDGANRADGAADGLMEVLVSNPAALGGPYRCRAQRISVTGGLFTYEADHALSGPVRERTWTVEPGAWRLTVPPAA